MTQLRTNKQQTYTTYDEKENVLLLDYEFAPSEQLPGRKPTLAKQISTPLPPAHPLVQLKDNEFIRTINAQTRRPPHNKAPTKRHTIQIIEDDNNLLPTHCG